MRRKSPKFPSALGLDQWLTCSWRRKLYRCLRPAPFSFLALKISKRPKTFVWHRIAVSFRFNSTFLPSSSHCAFTQVPKTVLQDHKCLIFHQLDPAVHSAVLHLTGGWGPDWPQVVQEPGTNWFPTSLISALAITKTKTIKMICTVLTDPGLRRHCIHYSVHHWDCAEGKLGSGVWS